jgi:hypothetical protein
MSLVADRMDSRQTKICLYQFRTESCTILAAASVMPLIWWRKRIFITNIRKCFCVYPVPNEGVSEYKCPPKLLLVLSLSAHLHTTYHFTAPLFWRDFVALPYSVKHNLSVDLLSAKSHKRREITDVSDQWSAQLHYCPDLSIKSVHIIPYGLTRLKDHPSHIRQNSHFSGAEVDFLNPSPRFP